MSLGVIIAHRGDEIPPEPQLLLYQIKQQLVELESSRRCRAWDATQQSVKKASILVKIACIEYVSDNIT